MTSMNPRPRLEMMADLILDEVAKNLPPRYRAISKAWYRIMAPTAYNKVCYSFSPETHKEFTSFLGQHGSRIQDLFLKFHNEPSPHITDWCRNLVNVHRLALKRPSLSTMLSLTCVMKSCIVLELDLDECNVDHLFKRLTSANLKIFSLRESSRRDSITHVLKCFPALQAFYLKRNYCQKEIKVYFAENRVGVNEAIFSYSQFSTYFQLVFGAGRCLTDRELNTIWTSDDTLYIPIEVESDLRLAAISIEGKTGGVLEMTQDLIAACTGTVTFKDLNLDLDTDLGFNCATLRLINFFCRPRVTLDLISTHFPHLQSLSIEGDFYWQGEHGHGFPLLEELEIRTNLSLPFWGVLIPVCPRLAAIKSHLGSHALDALSKGFPHICFND